MHVCVYACIKLNDVTPLELIILFPKGIEYLIKSSIPGMGNLSFSYSSERPKKLPEQCRSLLLSLADFYNLRKGLVDSPHETQGFDKSSWN